MPVPALLLCALVSPFVVFAPADLYGLLPVKTEAAVVVTAPDLLPELDSQGLGDAICLADPTFDGCD